MGEITVNIELTPEQVAEQFWQLGSDGQADFFAALDRIAGLKLCFQMAGVVQELTERSGQGNHEALNAFQTMLSHAQGYAESATDLRVWDAKRAIAKMAEGDQAEERR